MSRRIVYRCLGWAALIYAIFVVVVWFVADGIMYQVPSPTYPADDPALVRLEVDGQQVVTRSTDVPDERATVIFAHGNGGDIGPAAGPTAMHLAASGLDVVEFDYRGYGRSDGEPSEDGTYADIDAVYRYVTGDLDVDPAEVIVIGHSLGGGPAAWLAENRRVGGLMLWSTFTSAFDTAVPPWFLPIDRYETEDRLGGVHAPVAVIHGDRDEVVDVDHGYQVYAAANDPKRLDIVVGAGHEDVIEAGARFDESIEWLLSRSA